jgi:hypothetical protein
MCNRTVAYLLTGCVGHDYQSDGLRDLQPCHWYIRHASPIGLTQCDGTHVTQHSCGTIDDGPCYEQRQR